MKLLATILASQLPKDLQSRLQDKVREIQDDLDGEQGKYLTQMVKRKLVEHGHMLTKGNRNLKGIAKVAMVSEYETPTEDVENEKITPNICNSVSYTNDYRRGQGGPAVKRREGCYI